MLKSKVCQYNSVIISEIYLLHTLHFCGLQLSGLPLRGFGEDLPESGFCLAVKPATEMQTAEHFHLMGEFLPQEVRRIDFIAYLLMISGPLITVICAPTSLAMARPIMVLPVPGGP